MHCKYSMNFQTCPKRDLKFTDVFKILPLIERATVSFQTKIGVSKKISNIKDLH